jgi:hypothetical protein
MGSGICNQQLCKCHSWQRWGGSKGGLPYKVLGGCGPAEAVGQLEEVILRSTKMFEEPGIGITITKAFRDSFRV